MANIAFVLIAFQADHTLEACLRSVLPFGKVYAAEGPVTFWQRRGYKSSTDRTNAILEKYYIPCVHGQWREKDDEANAALALVPDNTDFVFCVDADEIWQHSILEGVVREINTDRWDSMSFKAWSFYGGFERIMGGFEENFEVHRVQRFYPGARFSTHRPPTILAPDGKPWRAHRHMGHEATDKMGWRFHHYSYVFPEQMRMKAEYYAYMGGNIPDYYQSVYLPWVLGNDTARQVIEREYSGVHNWLPNRREACYTKSFDGGHPGEIARIMPELEERFALELGLTNEC